jgi:hypothetical protein
LTARAGRALDFIKIRNKIVFFVVHTSYTN